MNRIRVLIVEDSSVMREHLVRIVGADNRLEVAGAVGSGEEALEALDSLAPDVISMDVRLPGMDGLETTRRIMVRRPTPIVIVSAIEPGAMNLMMEALKAGALSVAPKPPAVSHHDHQTIAEQLCTQLVIMSDVAVVRRVPSKAQPELRPATCERGEYHVLGIAASTGGPNALMQVLSGIGDDYPLPILVVQHMEASFIEGFGAWLGDVTGFRVAIVHGRVEMRRGTVYLGAPDRHLLTDGRYAWAGDGEPVVGQRPSASVLFSSMASSVAAQGVGVVLTGMGEDGGEGLRNLRLAGGYTLAEDRSTAVVYGMPAAAVKLGAVCETLPLSQVATRLLSLVRRQSEE